MESRIEILKALVKEANDEFSYSAIMRKMRKQNPDKLQEFMKNFKEAFDLAKDKDMDSIEQVALMQAIKSIQ